MEIHNAANMRNQEAFPYLPMELGPHAHPHALVPTDGIDIVGAGDDAWW